MERNGGREGNSATQDDSNTARPFWGVAVQQGEYWECLGGNGKSNIGLKTVMGGMPGWAARLLVHCPALVNANVRFLCLFFGCSCLLTISVQRNGEYYSLQWGCRCCGNGDGRDAGLGGAPFGTLPGLGERQRSLLCLLFHWSCLLTICMRRNGGVLRFAMGLPVF